MTGSALKRTFMTVLANLMEQRERRNRRQHRRYYIQRVFDCGKSIALLLFGVWCYTVRGEIQTLLVDFFTQ